MKTNRSQKMFTVIVVAGLALSAATLRAQSVPAGSTPQPAVVSSVPQLSDGASQILRLAQAKVGDETIIAFVRNSGSSYPLTADQIIYLRQQGVSDAVVNVMLNQPRLAASAQPSAASTITTASGSTATVAPTVTYVQTAPAAYYYQPYYYPSYAWYPPVTFSFGWGWHGGGGWRR